MSFVTAAIAAAAAIGSTCEARSSRRRGVEGPVTRTPPPRRTDCAGCGAPLSAGFCSYCHRPSVGMEAHSFDAAASAVTAGVSVAEMISMPTVSSSEIVSGGGGDFGGGGANGDW